MILNASRVSLKINKLVDLSNVTWIDITVFDGLDFFFSWKAVWPCPTLLCCGGLWLTDPPLHNALDIEIYTLLEINGGGE